uniref:Acid phosphatase n=1 Tax=Oryza glaberrima TaxID=4538 RepID=I1PT30_ORYGL
MDMEISTEARWLELTANNCASGLLHYDSKARLRWCRGVAKVREEDPGLRIRRSVDIGFFSSVHKTTRKKDQVKFKTEDGGEYGLRGVYDVTARKEFNFAWQDDYGDMREGVALLQVESRGRSYRDSGSLLFTVSLMEGSAPALAGTLRLYQRLLELGIKPVFLTVRTENQRAVTIRNLSQQGYSGWEKLVLQPTGGLSIEAFKSGERQKLVSDGYAIVGNIGDQWSDLLGPAAGARTFKLSNRIWSLVDDQCTVDRKLVVFISSNNGIDGFCSIELVPS